MLALAATLLEASPTSGAPLATVIGAAAGSLARALGAEAVAYADLPVGATDALVAGELAWDSAVAEAGLARTDAPGSVAEGLVSGRRAVVGDSGTEVWVGLRGPSGAALGALVARRASSVDEAHVARAGAVAELLAGAIRRWVDEARLVRSARMLEDTQRHTHVGSFEWDVVSNRVRWSDELYRLYGCEPQSFEASFEQFLERIHPDDRQSIQESVTRAYEERTGYRIEERIIRPDGEIRQLTSWGEVIVDGDGHPLKIIGSCQDVTELRRMTGELAASEARFRTLVESAPDAVLVCGSGDRVIDANPAAASLFGRPVSDLAGCPFDELVVEGHAQRPGRTGVPADVRLARLPGCDGEVLAAFVRDVSEQVAAEEASRLRRERELHRAQALMLNDNVVQSLASAAYALDADQLAQASHAVRATLDAAREMMSNLLSGSQHPVRPGDLVRSEPTPGVLDLGLQPVAGAPRLRDNLPAGTVTVVVADDNDDFRFLVRSVLDPRKGVAVIAEASDGIDAVSLVRRHQPDVVVLDVAMPGLDGLQVLERLKATTPSLPVVMLTGSHDVKTAVKATQLGAFN
ncbi:MAG TPA: response regulator, partial [Acidimicrobiia bacterium]|nr:response regulator [Acidimicrobiia bacterium]